MLFTAYFDLGVCLLNRVDKIRADAGGETDSTKDDACALFVMPCGAACTPEKLAVPGSGLMLADVRLRKRFSSTATIGGGLAFLKTPATMSMPMSSNTEFRFPAKTSGFKIGLLAHVVPIGAGATSATTLTYKIIDEPRVSVALHNQEGSESKLNT